MPWVKKEVEVWISDQEQRAADEGWVSCAEATRILNRSRSFVEAMSRQQVIGHQRVAGRDYYDLQDIEELAAGGTPSDRHKREGNRLMAEWGGPSTPSPATPADVQADPLAAFVRRHVEGGGR